MISHDALMTCESAMRWQGMHELLFVVESLTCVTCQLFVGIIVHKLECSHLQKRKQVIEERQSQREAKKSKQDSVQTHAAWTFLGSQTSQLWLLDDEHLQVYDACVMSDGILSR